ncbi:MAG: ABC transporter permease [Bacillota bacterium]|nr:ABC transporter permease [Bacillota bacterium]
MLGNFLSLALVRASIRMATPLTLAALGGAVTMQAGILNIALEGMMLAGAFFAVAASHLFANAWLGLLAGVVAATLIGLLYAFFVVDLKGDTFVIGIALNIFAAGGTVYLLRSMFGVKGAFVSDRIRTLPDISIGLANVSGPIAEVLDGYSILTYVSWALVLAFSILFYRTAFGLRLRAAGEHPVALETVGVSTRRMRYLAYLGSGILCGLGGAHLSLGYLNQFAENMVAGRGFIALAATIFGQGRPLPVFLACVLFGAADSVAIRFQGLGIPPQFALMTPYVVTTLALWLVSRPRAPRVKEATAHTSTKEADAA